MDERTLVVLLHGLGATGAVWHGVGAALEAQGYRTLVPDLAGHGTTPGSAPYTLAQLAERVSALPNATASWYLCGHSLGGYVALEVAARAPWGAPRAAISLGAKLAFSDEERAQMALLAKRPARTFPTRAQALDRYRRVAGLAPDCEEAYLERAVVACDEGYRLAQDPAVAAIGVPSFAALAAGAGCPVYVARGALDALVTRAECEALSLPYEEFAGLGHNAHVEAPARVAAYIAALVGTRRS